MKNILFDSYAILKFYQDEKGADKVEELLAASAGGNTQSFISEINLGEVYYQVIRRMGIDFAGKLLDQFSMLPVRVVAPDSAIIMSAAEIKAGHAISYADCFAVATAIRYSAAIVTGDPEFAKTEYLAPVIWV